ncbi:transposase [Streptomyces sp. NPDC056713]|uniref:transposase n=1 Tax=Streptomyces sp. NPDC056713 TaxID=3345921 RepID=UPI0036B7D896
MRLADSPSPSAGGVEDPAARLLLALPLLDDLDVPEVATVRLGAALTSTGENGKVYAWGRGIHGQLGNGNRATSSVPRQKLVTVLRREGADRVRRGRPWGLPLEDRVLLVAAYWRTNLTMRQLAPLFGVSRSAADRIIDQLGPLLAFPPRHRFARDAVLIVDGALVPTRDHRIAEQSKNCRYSTNHQIVIDADTRLVVVVGDPLPGNRNDCKAWSEYGAKAAVGRALVMADGGYPGTGLLMLHRRTPGEELPDWKREHNRSHKQVRARVEHVFARMKTWKILRDCRLEGDGVHHAMLGIARLHNLNLAG